jgi:hypothetical protein
VTEKLEKTPTQINEIEGSRECIIANREKCKLRVI